MNGLLLLSPNFYGKCLLLLNFVPFAQSTIQCGAWSCHGAAYCCGDDFQQCCFYTPVYHFWWFWLIWATIFFVLATCSYLCWKRRITGPHFIQPNIAHGQRTCHQTPPNGRVVPADGYQAYNISGQPFSTMPPVPPPYQEMTKSGSSFADKSSDNPVYEGERKTSTKQQQLTTLNTLMAASTQNQGATRLPYETAVTSAHHGLGV